jgi:hypothetical protein
MKNDAAIEDLFARYQPDFFSEKNDMRRKSCIFAAKFAENNNCIIRTRIMEYVYLGTKELATIQVG